MRIHSLYFVAFLAFVMHALMKLGPTEPTALATLWLVPLLAIAIKQEFEAMERRFDRLESRLAPPGDDDERA